MSYSPIGRPSTELNLLEVIWDLLAQWKGVLIIALCMALLTSGLKHNRDMKAYKAEVENKSASSETESLEIDEKIDTILSALSPDDKAIVEYVVKQREWIDTELDYINNSILLNVDPTSQRTLQLDYYISADDNNDSIESSLAYSYSSYVYNDSIIDGLRQIINPNLDNKYISEIISTPLNVNGSSGYINSIDDGDVVLTVRIVLPEDIDAVAVENIITSAFKEFSAELNKEIGSHTISLIRQNEAKLFNSNAVSNKNSLIANIYNMQNTYNKNTESSLSDVQKKAVTAITQIKEAEKIAEISTSDTEAAQGEIAKPGYSKRYMAMGFVIGAFLYAGCYLLLVLLKRKVESADILESCTGSRLLGEVYSPKKSTGIKALLHSDLVDKIRYRNKKDTNESIELITSTIESVCKHAAISEVAILSMVGPDPESISVRDAIVAEARNKGIIANLLDVADNLNENELLSIKNAIIIAEKNNTLSDLQRNVRLCNSYDINQLGCIFVSR